MGQQGLSHEPTRTAAEHPRRGGRPLVVEDESDRIGAGPWARWLASAVVPDESSARAQRGRTLAWAGAVDSVELGPGRISARVAGSTGEPLLGLDRGADRPRPGLAGDPPVGPRPAGARDGRPGRDAVRPPRASDVHRARRLSRTGARDSAPIVHVPGRRVRGSVQARGVARVRRRRRDRPRSLALPPLAGVRAGRGGPGTQRPVEAGPLPEPRPLRALPPGAVLKRLGRSGIRVAGVDLADALAPAYEAFAATRADRA